jgi:hypothetical protein
LPPAGDLLDLADSLTAFVGHPACNTGTLRADLHRFAFLFGVSDGEECSPNRHRDHRDTHGTPA